MTISISCPHCGAHFKLDDAQAGRTGRCHTCGQQMKIPAPTPAAAQTRGQHPVQADKVNVPADGESDRPHLHLNSHAGLVPISDPDPPQVQPDNPDQEDESGLYRIATVPVPPQQHDDSRPAGPLKWFYRHGTRWLLRTLHRISESAYLISTPFVFAIMLGILLNRRDLAVLGAVGVILPNLLRFIVNGTCLLVTPFKDNPVQGVLFFIPPFTFYYLYKHWKQMKHAAAGFLAPLIPIVCVVLVFVFVPWLSSGTVPENASLKDRTRAEVESLESEIKQDVNKLKDSDQVRKLTERTREGVESAKEAADQQLQRVRTQDQ